LSKPFLVIPHHHGAERSPKPVMAARHQRIKIRTSGTLMIKPVRSQREKFEAGIVKCGTKAAEGSVDQETWEHRDNPSASAQNESLS